MHASFTRLVFFFVDLKQMVLVFLLVLVYLVCTNLVFGFGHPNFRWYIFYFVLFSSKKPLCDVISSSFSKFENQEIQNLQSPRLSLDFVILKKEELCVPRLPTLRSTATNRVGVKQTRRAACRAIRRRRRTLPCLASLFSGKLEVAAHWIFFLCCAPEAQECQERTS